LNSPTETRNTPGSTCRVLIAVEDRNDLPPVFTRLPRGNIAEIRNDVSVNTRVATVKASDGDGTSPANMVRYRLEEGATAEDYAGKATDNFAIDAETGVITVTGDLAQDLYDEYRLKIIAEDMGEPSLEASVLIVVNVRQVVALSSGDGVGFARTDHSIQTAEGVVDGGGVRPLATLELERLPAPERGLRLGCRVVRAVNAKGRAARGMFSTRMTADRACQLLLLPPGLDREEEESYQVDVVIDTLSSFLNAAKRRAKISITVTDENDNAPEFAYPSTLEASETYVAAVRQGAPVGTRVTSVKATDVDSGQYGRVAYKFKDNDGVFKVDAKTGVVTVADDVGQAGVKREVVVVAEDDPDGGSLSNSQTTMLIVNVVQPEDVVVLALNGIHPSEVRENMDELEALLAEQTGLAVTVDRVAPTAKLNLNGTCCLRIEEGPEAGTDVHLLLVDPQTGDPLSYDDERVSRVLTGEDASAGVRYSVSDAVQARGAIVRRPHPGGEMDNLHGDHARGDSPIPAPVTEVTRAGGGGFGDVWHAVLVAVGCLILALAASATFYLCLMKRRIRTKGEKEPRMIVIPRYEPVFVDPTGSTVLAPNVAVAAPAGSPGGGGQSPSSNSKEYETQVLKMSVPTDETDSSEIQDRDSPNLEVSRSSYWPTR